MCSACQHPHFEGQKCEICGHIGRTEAVRSLSRSGPTDPNLHFVAEDASTLPPDRLRGHLLLAAILRRQVFCDEMELPEGPFELTDGDYMWRHVFAQSTPSPCDFAAVVGRGAGRPAVTLTSTLGSVWSSKHRCPFDPPPRPDL